MMSHKQAGYKVEKNKKTFKVTKVRKKWIVNVFYLFLFFSPILLYYIGNVLINARINTKRKMTNSITSAKTIHVEILSGYPPSFGGEAAFEGIVISYEFSYKEEVIKAEQFLKNNPENQQLIDYLLGGDKELYVRFDSLDTAVSTLVKDSI